MTINQRELRNDSGRIMREVAAGKSFVVSSNGEPVAELRPLYRRRFIDARAAIALMTGAPRVDVAALRADADALIDPDAPDRV